MADVTPKVKNFIWRACLDVLPTQTNLFDKGIVHCLSCRWCEEEAETVSHVLWHYEFAQKVWGLSSINFPLECLQAQSFHDVIMFCISFLKTPGLEIVFSTAWCLWQAHN